MAVHVSVLSAELNFIGGIGDWRVIFVKTASSEKISRDAETRGASEGPPRFRYGLIVAFLLLGVTSIKADDK